MLLGFSYFTIFYYYFILNFLMIKNWEKNDNLLQYI